MSDSILVINSGSSSVKFASFAVTVGRAPVRLLHGEVDGIGGSAPRLRAWAHEGEALEERTIDSSSDDTHGHEDALQALFDWLAQHPSQGRPIAAAHRVVHGGTNFVAPTRVTPAVLAQLDGLVALAPLHQPHNLAAIRAITALQPGLPQIACFDTAFHADQPWVMQAFALPQRISRLGVRRYGFHGLSYEYIAGVLPDHLGAAAEGRVVVAHLGNGASLCAMHHRRSVATTMGFTALDGLMMGTRCGDIDPGVLLYLMAELRMNAADVQTLLYQQSGLLGVSGISADMRTLEASRHPDASLAIDLYVNRISRELGAMAAMLGGLDALVFTAGIGEHSAAIRERVCADSGWLGIVSDLEANRAHAPCISAAGSRTSAWVIPTNEELMLATHAQALLASGGG